MLPFRCAGDWAAYGLRKWVEQTGQTSNWIDLVQTNSTTARKLTKLGSTVTAAEYGPVWDPTGTVVAFQGDDSNSIYQVPRGSTLAPASRLLFITQLLVCRRTWPRAKWPFWRKFPWRSPRSSSRPMVSREPRLRSSCSR